MGEGWAVNECKRIYQEHKAKDESVQEGIMNHLHLKQNSYVHLCFGVFWSSSSTFLQPSFLA